MNTKFKLSSNQGEKRLRKKIIRDWTSEKKVDIKDKLMVFRNNDLPKVKLPVKSVTVHSSGTKSNNEIICKMINDMDSLHYELKKERKSLSKILYKINDKWWNTLSCCWYWIIIFEIWFHRWRLSKILHILKMHRIILIWRWIFRSKAKSKYLWCLTPI